MLLRSLCSRALACALLSVGLATSLRLEPVRRADSASVSVTGASDGRPDPTATTANANMTTATASLAGTILPAAPTPINSTLLNCKNRPAPATLLGPR